MSLVEAVAPIVHGRITRRLDILYNRIESERFCIPSPSIAMLIVDGKICITCRARRVPTRRVPAEMLVT